MVSGGCSVSMLFMTQRTLVLGLPQLHLLVLKLIEVVLKSSICLWGYVWSALTALLWAICHTEWVACIK